MFDAMSDLLFIEIERRVGWDRGIVEMVEMVETLPLSKNLACLLHHHDSAEQSIKILFIFGSEFVSPVAILVTNAMKKEFHTDNLAIFHLGAFFTVKIECF